MKPRIRLIRGMWYCGPLSRHNIFWACGETPQEAYDLWVRCQ